MTADLPEIVRHPDRVVEALLVTAYFHEELGGLGFEVLARQIADGEGLDPDTILRGLAEVADTIDEWALCSDDAATYAHGRQLAKPGGITWGEWGSAELDVLRTHARYTCERLVERARPNLAAVSS